MDLHEAQIVKRQVRRDTSISNGAARLFAEITDLHCMEQGCFAKDGTLAEWLGCTERTIRRWKRELEAADYLTSEHRNGRRYCVPNGDVCDKPPDTERTKMSAPPDKNVQDPDKNVRTKMSNTDSIYIPPSGVNTREARARGNPASGNGHVDGQTADEIYRSVTGHPNPGAFAVDLMRQTVDEGKSRDGPLPGSPEDRRGFWEMIVRTWADSDSRNERQPRKLLNDFTDQLRAHYERSDNRSVPTDPIENRKRILRAAAEGAGLTG